MAIAADVGQDFCGRPYDTKLFRTTGSNIAKAIRVEPQGLRITLPPNHVNSLPVGLVSRTRVRGYFEITVAFEILRFDKPTAGKGAGLSLYITTASVTNDAA